MILFLTLFVFVTIAWAQYARTRLVLDMRNEATLPKHFRTSNDLSMNDNVDETGLADLHIAGSAQFSKLSLQQVLQHLKTKHVTIIDLRQESHGFLNGNAVSWYGPHNADNTGKKALQIEKDQAQALHQLEKQQSVKVDLILKKTANELIDKTKTMEFNVHSVSTEADLAGSLHLNYRRLYIQDFHPPTAQQVDQFIKMVQTIPKNQWIYFHCRGGVGRSTTFMVMYDMMHNAKRVSFDAILVRQKAIGGKDLREIPSDGWKQKYAILRLNFLKDFYHYCYNNNDKFETSWTTWVKLNRKNN